MKTGISFDDLAKHILNPLFFLLLADPSMITRKKTTFWMRLAAAVQYGGAAALVKLWRSGTIKFLPHLRGEFTPENIPSDAEELYEALDSMRTPAGIWKVRQYLLHYQVSLVLPEKSRRTEIGTFDIRLHAQLLSNITTVKNEETCDLRLDLNQPTIPSGTNYKIGDYTRFLTQFRDFLMHYPAKNMTHKDFERYWELLVWILHGLGFESDKIADLKVDLNQDDPAIELAVTRAMGEQASAQVTEMIVKNPSGSRNAINQLQRIISHQGEVVISGVQDICDGVAEKIQEDVQENRECVQHLTGEIQEQGDKIAGELRELRQQNDRMMASNKEQQQKIQQQQQQIEEERRKNEEQRWQSENNQKLQMQTLAEELRQQQKQQTEELLRQQQQYQERLQKQQQQQQQQIIVFILIAVAVAAALCKLYQFD